jgi:regulatory protein
MPSFASLQNSMALEALEKIKHYCAYQERSHQEVRFKLIELGIFHHDLENYIAILIEENFLNEERYARAIARGKFYYKQWGRNKILQTLKLQKVSNYCIQKAMQEIDENDYIATFQKLAQNKLALLRHEKNKFTKMKKLQSFMLQRGFEYEYINSFVKENF